MKKERNKKYPRMMIISTMIMVVLLIISISTATFAWFSANTIVGTNTLTFTAQHTGDANISISWEPWTEGTAITSNELELSAADPLKPCIPKELPEEGETYFDTFRLSFRGATIGIPKGQSTEEQPLEKVFNSNGEPESPFLSKRPQKEGFSGDQYHFYVTNHGVTPINLEVYFRAVESQENENLGLLRMSIFVGDDPEQLKYYKTLVALDQDELIDQTPDTHYGIIEQGGKPEEFETIETFEYTPPIEVAGNNGYKVFAFVAWYDGVYLDDVKAGKQASIEVIFKSA